MPEPIDTRKVNDRRQLRFESAAELDRDIASLLEAERNGALRRTGNWELGQALGHIAAWASYPYEGYLPEMRPPWFVRMIGRLMKKRMLSGDMPAGFRIPKVEGGTWAIERMSSDEGAERCRVAFERLERETPAIPNPIFGPLTHDEWKRMNLGHAALHLSFFHPD